MEPNSHAEGSKGSARLPSPPCGSLAGCLAQITLDPYPFYLAAGLGKLGATRWRCDKPAGGTQVVGSLLIALLAMPGFNPPTPERAGMFALPLGLFPIPKPSGSTSSDPSLIERKYDGDSRRCGWVPSEMDVCPISLFPRKVRDRLP